MKVVQIEDVPPVRGLEHRGGTFHSQTTAEGASGSPGNFKFSLSRLGTDYSGPRHRHNFDQYRFMIEGESDYGQDGPLKAGMLGYYPEGVHYGPQVNKTEILCAVLQFGGASGSGYLPPREVKAGMEKLKTFGVFRDGVFYRREGVSGRRNLDAYQAIWEYVHEREMVYPKGRYNAPIFADSRNYDWAPVEGAPGVCKKLFGVWTERRTQAGLLRLEAGASHEVIGRGVYLVLNGIGTCQGSPLKQFTTVYLDHDERTRLFAGETAELLHYGLPDLRGLAAVRRATGRAMQAAE
ncbi:MAG TPA: hypothetical protein VH684_02330 [Xanthobacteraceae bacterium]